MARLRLPKPAAECLDFLDRRGHEPSRCKWRVERCKKRLGIRSYRSHDGWFWSKPEIQERFYTRPALPTIELARHDVEGRP
jgi:hypothetical protein